MNSFLIIGLIITWISYFILAYLVINNKHITFKIGSFRKNKDVSKITDLERLLILRDKEIKKIKREKLSLNMDLEKCRKTVSKFGKLIDGMVVTDKATLEVSKETKLEAELIMASYPEGKYCEQLFKNRTNK